MEPSPGEISALLRQLSDGDRNAESQLVPLVYDELRRLARRYLRSDRADSLQATDLVNEAFLKLRGTLGIGWEGRAHFFAVASTQMRRILIDHARKKFAGKRFGGQIKLSLDAVAAFEGEQFEHLIDLDRALEKLARLDARQARAVELRFFSGLSLEEIAAVLGVNERTVKRDWVAAKAWLYGELSASRGAL